MSGFLGLFFFRWLGFNAGWSFSRRIIVISPTNDPDAGTGNQSRDEDQPEPLHPGQPDVSSLEDEDGIHAKGEDSPGAQAGMAKNPILDGLHEVKL